MIEGWITDEIDNLCNVEYGTRVVQKNDGGTIYPVYGGGGATFFMDTHNREDRLTIARFAMSAKCTRFVKGKFFLNDSGLTLSPKNTSKIEQAFLNYQCLALNDKFYSLAKGSAQKNLDVPAFRKLKLNIPNDIKIQQKIVAKLDSIFAEIDKATAAAEANAKNAEALFQSYLSNIQGPKSHLGEFVTIKTGKLDSNASVEDGKYPFFTCSKEIFSINEYAFDCEAVLLAGNNASGDFNVKYYKGKFNAYQRTYVITIDALDNLTYRYLYFQLVNALKKFKSMSVGANTKFLKIGMIRKLEFPLPEMSEQLRILKKLTTVEEMKDLLKMGYVNKLELSNKLKLAILKQAFNGELVKE